MIGRSGWRRNTSGASVHQHRTAIYRMCPRRSHDFCSLTDRYGSSSRCNRSRFNIVISPTPSVGRCVCHLSLCGPVMDWRPVQVYPASRPKTAGIGPPMTLNWIKRVWKMDGWMTLMSGTVSVFIVMVSPTAKIFRCAL